MQLQRCAHRDTLRAEKGLAGRAWARLGSGAGRVESQAKGRQDVARVRGNGRAGGFCRRGSRPAGGRAGGTGRRSGGIGVLYPAHHDPGRQRRGTGVVPPGVRQSQRHAPEHQSVDGALPVDRPARSARLGDGHGDSAHGLLEGQRVAARRHLCRGHPGPWARMRAVTADRRRNGVRRRRHHRIAEKGLCGDGDRLSGLHQRGDPDLCRRARGGTGRPGCGSGGPAASRIGPQHRCAGDRVGLLPGRAGRELGSRASGRLRPRREDGRLGGRWDTGEPPGDRRIRQRLGGDRVRSRRADRAEHRVSRRIRPRGAVQRRRPRSSRKARERVRDPVAARNSATSTAPNTRSATRASRNWRPNTPPSRRS